jgi:hypothetical protein
MCSHVCRRLRPPGQWLQHCCAVALPEVGAASAVAFAPDAGGQHMVGCNGCNRRCIEGNDGYDAHKGAA